MKGFETLANKLLKYFSCILTCCILLQTAASATEAIEPQASLYIAGTHVNIAANSNGELTISFSVSCLDEMTEVEATTIYLYEDNGNTKKCVKTYRYTDKEYKYILAKNTVYYGSNVSYNGTIGYDYYATIYLKAGNSTGSDTVVSTTRTVTASK